MFGFDLKKKKKKKRKVGTFEVELQKNICACTIEKKKKKKRQIIKKSVRYFHFKRQGGKCENVKTILTSPPFNIRQYDMHAQSLSVWKKKEMDQSWIYSKNITHHSFIYLYNQNEAINLDN